ncbi:hypothetical protein AB0N38_26410 [Micromonospora aurantiaca]|uniref:hypothetical protein n=1 Tax=Micromonospora aurantiaca (nom. illeg.) TaxID=47850 RepID=UPI00343BA603
MTAVPLPRALRRPLPPLNHSADPCPFDGCRTPPLTAHRSGCLIALPYPAEARVFRGVLIGLVLVAAPWLIFFLALIWS